MQKWFPCKLTSNFRKSLKINFSKFDREKKDDDDFETDSDTGEVENENSEEIQEEKMRKVRKQMRERMTSDAFGSLFLLVHLIPHTTHLYGGRHSNRHHFK